MGIIMIRCPATGRGVSTGIEMFATDQLPVLSNFHNPNVHAFLSSLKGPAFGAADRLNLWNVQDWELS